MKRIAKLFLAALLASIGGLAVILAVLYLGNSGSDFTPTDFTGFGVLFLVASTLLMLLVYLPGLFWLRRKNRKRILFPLFSGLLLNLPVFVLLAILIGWKMSASESIGFMLTFMVAGLVFGLGFAGTELAERAQSE